MKHAARRTKPAILALLNNALEDFVIKGQASWYPGYVNVDNLFGEVNVLYRYKMGGRGRAFGMRFIKVRDLQILAPLLLFFKTVRAAKNMRPSIIRAYNTQLEALAAVLTQMITRVPCVVSLHGDYDELVRVRGYRAHIRFMVSLVEKFVVRRAKGVWCVTPYVAERAVKLGAEPGRVKVIFNKVKIDQFKQAPALRSQMRRRLGLANQFTILHVGRFNIQKNLITIVRAVALLRQEGRMVKLLLCGDDHPHSMDPPIRPILEAECKRLGVERDVLFSGYIPNDQLPAYYGAADAFVFASLVIGFGVVLVEAQASGLPVIGSDILYTKDKVVIDPSNSLLFNPRSPKQLAQAIRQLMGNPKLRRKLSDASRMSAKRYAWERIARLEARYYREIIRTP